MRRKDFSPLRQVHVKTPASVIQLAERAHEIIEITELEPYDGRFIGKRINRDGSLSDYPKTKWWRQRVTRVPASVSHLFAYLREARTRNICLIRGAPANLEPIREVLESDESDVIH